MSTITVLVLVVVGFQVLMYLMQDQLVFFPQRLPEAHRESIAKRLPDTESLFLDAGDGVRLHAWHRKAPAGAPLVIYFGGNAEEVSWMLEEVSRRAPGVAWLLVDYRGYGASSGAPTEAALVADALRWHDRFSKERKVIYAFGRSLGSGVAVQLAAERELAGVILVAPFDSLVEVGKRHYWYLPVGLLLRHRFDSLERAPRIKAPLLCLVAPRDEIIPVAHSKRLFDAWAGPKRWVDLDGAGHNNTDDTPAFWQSIRAFLEKKDGPPAPP